MNQTESNDKESLINEPNKNHKATDASILAIETLIFLSIVICAIIYNYYRKPGNYD